MLSVPPQVQGQRRRVHPQAQGPWQQGQDLGCCFDTDTNECYAKENAGGGFRPVPNYLYKTLDRQR